MLDRHSPALVSNPQPWMCEAGLLAKRLRPMGVHPSAGYHGNVSFGWERRWSGIVSNSQTPETQDAYQPTYGTMDTPGDLNPVL